MMRSSRSEEQRGTSSVTPSLTTPQTPKLSFLEKRIATLSSAATWTKKKEQEEDIHGQLGLQLLYEPAEPHVDFIFVHGLGGGSRKTWSQTNSSLHYWPKEWLPTEPGFKHVRIHSYGYHSNWGERPGSILNVHDFAQALLGEIETSPLLRRDSETAIVLIGHSMGGIVLKCTYMLAKQDKNLQSIADRIHSLYFIATPHRGADSARLLRNLISISPLHSAKAYVADLIPNSGALQIINDQFPHVCQGLRLWSFFETVKTNLGKSQELIVEKDSAVLGLPNEQVALLNADHRHVVKFSNPSDNNYIVLRNALASTVEVIEKSITIRNEDDYQRQIRLISTYLKVLDFQGDLTTALDSKLDGSCVWLTESKDFNKWHQGYPGTPGTLWLSGNPGTGKSVLAGHVVRYLEQCNADCSYHFFKQNNKTTNNIAAMLRSLAFQMALSNPKVLRSILQMYEDGEQVDKDDERTLWRTLFLTRICRIDFAQPYFWIIDAIDECNQYSKIFPILHKITEQMPLRIFITSRLSPRIDRLFAQEKVDKISVNVQLHQTLSDIRFYLESNSRFLLVASDEERQLLIEQIIQKSNGSFLWVHLVLKALEDAHTEKQIKDCLLAVPDGMNQTYQHILQDMLLAPKNIPLAQAILRWTICSVRPLTIDELREALRLDINETISQLENTIGSVCGNLLSIDSLNRVQPIHSTISAFLLDRGLVSEFAINAERAHHRIAEVCLNYMADDDLKSSRNRRFQASRKGKRSAFLNYACSHFSDHVARSSSSDDSLLLSMDRFLRTNVLSWIEFVAQSGNLQPLISTAKNIRSYLQRRAKYLPPLGSAMQTVSAWVGDLIHLVTAFGRALLEVPQAIHFLIPPVCPAGSVIHKSFGKIPRSLTAVGIVEDDWDDCLSYNAYECTANALACKDNKFAVGLSNGRILLYHTSTCQAMAALEHEQPLRVLRFGSSNSLLASASWKNIKLWNTNSKVQLWQVGIPNAPLSMSFTEDDCIMQVVTRANSVRSWNVSDGVELEAHLFADGEEDDSDGHRQTVPEYAEISKQHNLVAAAYRCRPVSLWDLEDDSFIGFFELEGVSSFPAPKVEAMIFNPNPDLEYIAIAYSGGEIAVYDIWGQMQQALVFAYASALAASPDGKTLATGDSNGTIKLFDFETLRLMYVVNSHDYDIKKMVFSSNSLRLLDIRGSYCHVWEPAVLVRKDASENTSVTASESVQGSKIEDVKAWDRNRDLSALAAHDSGEYVFAGREDGTVALFETRTGSISQELYQHAKLIGITALVWSPEASVLASSDISGRYVVRSIARNASRQWVVKDAVIDSRSARPIAQMIFSSDGHFLLVSSADTDFLWSTTGHLITLRKGTMRKSWKWVISLIDANSLYLFENGTARIFSFASLEELTRGEGISIENAGQNEAQHADLAITSGHNQTMIRLSDGSTKKLFVWDTTSLTSDISVVTARPVNATLAVQLKTIIGLHKSALVFLNPENWVCSAEIKAGTIQKIYHKHFLIPSNWLTRHPIFCMTGKGSVAMIRRNDVAIFHRGLDSEMSILIE